MTLPARLFCTPEALPLPNVRAARLVVLLPLLRLLFAILDSYLNGGLTMERNSKRKTHNNTEFMSSIDASSAINDTLGPHHREWHSAVSMSGGKYCLRTLLPSIAAAGGGGGGGADSR